MRRVLPLLAGLALFVALLWAGDRGLDRQQQWECDHGTSAACR